MTTATQDKSEIDELRTELAELRADLRRATKAIHGTVHRPNGGGVAAATGITSGLAALIARLTGNFVSDAVIKRGRIFQRPMERAITGHPVRAALIAVAAAMLFGRYFTKKTRS